MYGTNVDIPDMKKCPNSTQWKKLINVWTAATSVEANKQADCILLTLQSEAENLALLLPDELQMVLMWQRSLTQSMKRTQLLFSAFEDFDSFKRNYCVPLY